MADEFDKNDLFMDFEKFMEKVMKGKGSRVQTRTIFQFMTPVVTEQQVFISFCPCLVTSLSFSCNIPVRRYNLSMRGLICACANKGHFNKTTETKTRVITMPVHTVCPMHTHTHTHTHTQQQSFGRNSV